MEENHWMDMEMGTEPLNANTCLAQEAFELFIAHAMTLSCEMIVKSSCTIYPLSGIFCWK